MQPTHDGSVFSPAHEANLNLLYLWSIALVAALGGLLFGYDWVVIGGARPFFEAYFHLTSQAQVGWANSCALIGCFLGSFAGGRASDRLGRKPVLQIAALLFAVSSICTGWSFHFVWFVCWRIVGGAAIGLASNVSPAYIAEISPAQWRGRLVSLNQLSIVVGILLAQTANWLIAQTVAADISAAAFQASWNVQYGWRWMFTAVAVPSIIFFCVTPFIPESPRWLVARGHFAAAQTVLVKIGGQNYGEEELNSVRNSLVDAAEEPRWGELFHGRIFRLVLVGIALAVLQQGSGINVLFNYAEEVYRSAGFGMNQILFDIVITGAVNLLFTMLAMLLVDRFGRRRLMILGCVSIALCHLAASAAFAMHVQGVFVLILTLAAIAFYAMTLAPITWVLITEIFPNRYRGSALSICVAALWIASFALTYTFPILSRQIGSSGTFLVYAAICFSGAVFIFYSVQETRGRTLESM